MLDKIVIGTRDSALAMWQTYWVRDRLEELYPDLIIEIKPIKTQGDKILDVALAKIGDKGLFTKELEVAMLNGEIDLAVHSMKDLPTLLPEGLTIGAITERHNPADIVITKGNLKLIDLPTGAIVGTSSLRRQAQLRHLRPDFILKDIRGNLNTRLKKFDEQDYDAMVLAAAGVERLGWAEKISEILDPEEFLPAVGQGALGIEIRENDAEIFALVSKLNHIDTALAITAERALLRNLEGGCQIPIGALGIVKDKQLILNGLVGSLDGATIIRHTETGGKENPEELGTKVAQVLRQQGAVEILAQIRSEFNER
ncbi:MAG: hydroxymethylbilane synthase [Bacillota bacterium]|nr:hydroxymethylbilane synthase [Bacillota bacterium]